MTRIDHEGIDPFDAEVCKYLTKRFVDFDEAQEAMADLILDGNAISKVTGVTQKFDIRDEQVFLRELKVVIFDVWYAERLRGEKSARNGSRSFLLGELFKHITQSGTYLDILEEVISEDVELLMGKQFSKKRELAETHREIKYETLKSLTKTLGLVLGDLIDESLEDMDVEGALFSEESKDGGRPKGDTQRRAIFYLASVWRVNTRYQATRQNKDFLEFVQAVLGAYYPVSGEHVFEEAVKDVLKGYVPSLSPALRNAYRRKLKIQS